MKHGFWMLIGCALPALLLFLLPVLGLGDTVTLIVAVALMLMCHLMMFFGHGRRAGHRHLGTTTRP